MGATITDIASAAGTSVAAVSVTLNGAKSKTLKVGPETRQRILAAAESLGYRRNPYAHSLATGRSRIIGLAFPAASSFTDHDPFYSLVTLGVTSSASEHRYHVLLYSESAFDADQKAAQMLDGLIAGLILVSPPKNSPLFSECDRQGIPYVAILAQDPHKGMSVGSDDYEGGLLATRHLIALGHRRIGHIGGKAEIATTAPRRKGYEDALLEAGIQPAPELCRPGEFNRAGGYQAARTLMAMNSLTRPTAIFAANDLSAHGCIEAVRDLGLSVPEDVAVVGYDDTWYSTMTRPPLTTVAMNVPAIGQCAAGLLVSTLSGQKPPDPHPVLPVSLTVRESCGANRRNQKGGVL